MRRLVSINLRRRLAVCEDDLVVPITHLFDATGADTTDDEAAISFVAGSDGVWFAERVADWVRAPLN